MDPIDRRALTRAIILAAAAAGLAMVPGVAPAMPLGESVPDALNGLIEETQWDALFPVARPLRATAIAPATASGVAGGIEVAAPAVGVGCETRLGFGSSVSLTEAAAGDR